MSESNEQHHRKQGERRSGGFRSEAGRDAKGRHGSSRGNGDRRGSGREAAGERRGSGKEGGVRPGKHDGRRGASRRGGQDADRMGARRPRGGKTNQGPSAGRKAALEVLGMVRERDAFARDLLAKHIDASSMSREDRAFATRLVLGVVSTSGTLDEMLDKCLDSPDDIQPDVRDALRISVYEMLFLEKTAYAAVNEGVELVRSFAPQAARLANAVLRRVSNRVEDFPFGDAERETAAFARKYAFPEWMALLMLRDLGMDAARDFLQASNEPAPLYIAINAAKADAEDVLPILEMSKGAPETVEIDGVPTLGCYRLADARVLVDGPVRALFDDGKIIVSDAAAQTVAQLVLPESKPSSFLEIGAGRGTKTVLIQSHAVRKYGSQLDDYVTVDNLEFKTKVLAERAKKCGLQVSETLTADALHLSDALGDRTFDAVFVDAPCSGFGTLRRHPEIRWKAKEEDVEAMAKQGLDLLRQAAMHVAPGGTLAYATCTVTHEENNAVVRRFLRSEEGADFALAPLRGKGCFSTRLVPDGPDAHFAVRFVRNS